MPAALGRMHAAFALMRELRTGFEEQEYAQDGGLPRADDDITQTSWGKMCRGHWVHVVHAAKAVVLLLDCLASEAKMVRRTPLRPGAAVLGPSKTAAWTDKSLRFAKVAVAALLRVPGHGKYISSKVLRNVISWQLKRLGISFPCGERWYCWDEMTKGLPKKFEEMASFGVDLTTPLTMVKSILDGGRNLPAATLRALQEMMFRLNDFDLGCLGCEFMASIQLLERKLGSIQDVHDLLKYVLHSDNALPKFLRHRGVNCGLHYILISPNFEITTDDIDCKKYVKRLQGMRSSSANASLPTWVDALMRNHGDMLPTDV